MPTPKEVSDQLLRRKVFKKLVTSAVTSKLRTSDNECNNCLELVKLYESSWNKLRDWEWKGAFMLWSGIAIATGIMGGNITEALGIKFNSSARLAIPTFLSWLCGMYWLIWFITMVISLSMQAAYRYFSRNRDFYIERATRQKNENLDKALGKGWPSSWEQYNLDLTPISWGLVVFHSVVAACLLIMSYLIIAAANDPKKKVNVAASAEMNEYDGVVSLNIESAAIKLKRAD
jgi:hypothetical protein